MKPEDNKKSFPIEKPNFNSKDSIDNFTKIMIEENPKKLSDKEKQDIHKIGQDMKKDALDYNVREVKTYRNDDPSTYLTDPKQRGRILEIGKLEKDLVPKIADQEIFKNNINRPVKRRNYFDDTVKLNVGNKGPLKLPELTPEEIERAKQPSDWDVIYGSMTPFEKGQWNNEQRREKLRRQKEFKKEPLSTPEKPREHFVLPSQRVRPVAPKVTQSLDQRLSNTKMSPGISIELVKLQKEINKNVDYVLGTDQKDSLESRAEEETKKETTYD